jgi:hypothetical protein
MTWSYSGDPASSDRDAIRFLIGDTDTDDQLLSNEEIDYCITQGGPSVYQAAHDCAYAIASKFSRMATSKSVGDMSLSYSDRAQAYFTLANELLELGARREPPTPWISPENIEHASDKTVPPNNGTEFWTGQMDYERGSYWRPWP